MNRQERRQLRFTRVGEQACVWLGRLFTLGFIGILAGLLYHIIFD